MIKFGTGKDSRTGEITGTGDGGHHHHTYEWWRDNTDKFLLFVLILILVGVDLHVLNRTTDAHIQFLGGLISMTLGALINMTTGSKPKPVASGASATATSNADPITGATTGTLKIESDKDGGGEK